MLRFRLFGMPVTIQASFLLVAAVLGFMGAGDPARTVAWVAIVFFSILIHELGHAFTARRYGSVVSIELNGLGGLTRWSVPEQEITPGRRALIAAAGSAVGVVFGALVWLVASQFAPYPPLTAFILDRLVYVNLFWGLINWLPIRPLDGGHLLESLLDKVAPRRSEAVARVVFMATAAIGLVLAVVFNLIFIAILAGLMLLSEMSAAGRPPVGATGFPTLSYEDPAQPNRDALPDERAPALDPPAEPIPDDTDHGGRQGPSH